jgi:hypothetical protein
MVERMKLGSGTTPADWVAEARSFRANHPADWWELQRHKLIHFWTPWLNPLIFLKSQVLASIMALAPLFLLAAFELGRRRRQLDEFLWLLLGLVGIGWLVGGLLFHVRFVIAFLSWTSRSWC